MPWWFYVSWYGALLVILIINVAVLGRFAEDSALLDLILTIIGFAAMLFVLWATIDYDNGNLGIDQVEDDGYAIATVFIVGIIASVSLTYPDKGEGGISIIIGIIAAVVLMLVWAFVDDFTEFTYGWIVTLVPVGYAYIMLIVSVCKLGDSCCELYRHR